MFCKDAQDHDTTEMRVSPVCRSGSHERGISTVKTTPVPGTSDLKRTGCCGCGTLSASKLQASSFAFVLALLSPSFHPCA
jgi:hypothetical protein